MGSIRRTLLISLLVLFTGVLLGVAATFDQIAGQSLTARAEAESGAVVAAHAEKAKEAEERAREQLLTSARALASQMQLQYVARFDQESKKLFALYAVLESMLRADPLTRTAWDAGNTRGQFAGAAARGYFAGMHLDEAFLTLVDQEIADPDTAPHRRLYQVNVSSRTASMWRSKSLDEVELPTPTGFSGDKLIDWKFDTVTVNGATYQRVVFRTPMQVPWFRLSFPGTQPNRGPGPGGGRPAAARPGSSQFVGPPAPPPAAVTPTAFSSQQFLDIVPKLYAHCAKPAAALEAELKRHETDRDAQLAAIRDGVSSERRRLRAAVLQLGGLGVLAILLCGGWFIRRGLKPLDRLTRAVGEVSERDFKLPVDRGQLSTELLPVHDRLTETLAALRGAFEREKQAVADISHELRTPVAALLTTLDVSLRKPRSAEQYRETMVECRGITKQLATLVERVMTLAYLDAGQAPFQPGPVDAAEVAEACAAVIRPLAEAHGVRFHLDAATVELSTDRDKLREVLMNLLHNGIEYTPAGGRLDLTVRPTAAGTVSFAVADTGIGMDAAVQGRIFERFYRADPSRTATGVHAGLGLAIVKEYVSRLGGQITVTSEPGRGSEFRVELPATAA